MARVLLGAIAERSARYPGGTSLSGDRAALAALERRPRGSGRDGGDEEGGASRTRAAALRGALRLRVAERSLLAAAEAAARILLRS